MSYIFEEGKGTAASAEEQRGQDSHCKSGPEVELDTGTLMLLMSTIKCGIKVGQMICTDSGARGGGPSPARICFNNSTLEHISINDACRRKGIDYIYVIGGKPSR